MCSFVFLWSALSLCIGAAVVQSAGVIFDQSPTHCIVACTRSFAIEIRELATGRLVKSIPSLNDPHELTIDRTHKMAYISIPYRDGIYGKNDRPKADIIEMVDLTKLEMVHIIDTYPHLAPHDMAVDEKKGILYCSFESNGGEIVAYNTSNAQKLFNISNIAPGPHWFSLLPNGKYIYTANKDATYVSVVDVENRSLVTHIAIPNGAEGIICSPDGRRVFVSSQSGLNMTVINTTDNTIIASVYFDKDAPGHFAVSPDGKMLYVTFNETDHGVQEIDIETLKFERKIESLSGWGRLNLLVTGDGRWMYVDNRINNSISVINMQTFKEERAFKTGNWPHGLGLFTYIPDKAEKPGIPESPVSPHVHVSSASSNYVLEKQLTKHVFVSVGLIVMALPLQRVLYFDI